MTKSHFDPKFYVLPLDTPICAIKCDSAFAGLTDKEKQYAYNLARASWRGALAVSVESPIIFVALHTLYSSNKLERLKEIATNECKFSDDEFQALNIYSAGFIHNNGNYKGFGDTKTIPDLDKSKLAQLLHKCLTSNSHLTNALIDWCVERIYALDERDRLFAFPNEGTTMYHSLNVKKEDSDRVDRFMKAHSLEGWNTRLFKTADTKGTTYDVRLASIEQGEVSPAAEFEKCFVKVTKGDYSEILKDVVHYLQEAKNHTANSNQTNMLEMYIKHFTTGSLDAHKDGSRFWIKDIGPAVESYIGFIENYRDPAGVRSEFEGFVAAVDRDMTKKFTRLVENAEELLKRLPWGTKYEKDKFLRPDFTSLDVLAFASSGSPAGINIPNYDEIRQSEGFKNVSLGNVIGALPKRKISFLKPEDEELYQKFFKQSFEVQVGLHELLGHGSGKLFMKNKDGTYNFEIEEVMDLDTNQKVTCWYEEGETWGTKFGALGCAYEECRAEAVGYVLSCDADVLKIFDLEGSDADDVKYVNWLSELRSGLLSLEMYSPEKESWGQAHSHARFVLLRVSIEGGDQFVKMEEVTGEDGQPDLIFTIDRAKIDTVGKPATMHFLKLLQAYKSMGDFKRGKQLFDKYGVPDEYWLRIRDIVVARRQPRRLNVQPNMIMENNKVTLKNYEESAKGLIESMVERYEPKHYDQIMTVWKRDVKHFGVNVPV